MASTPENTDDEKMPAGKGEGGGDASGPGNILAGVQPEEGHDEEGEERRED